ncbi:hypothetical protein lerEdw1_003237 [Lerista edwardsae]|nr:hypothetical protein lerEdw1_003237 [Lerista edwardsae]
MRCKLCTIDNIIAKSHASLAMKCVRSAFPFRCKSVRLTYHISMPVLCHILAVAFVQIFIVSGNWILAKNINFYNVRLPVDRKYPFTRLHFQAASSVLLVTVLLTITAVTDGLKINGVLRVSSVGNTKTLKGLCLGLCH